MTATVPLGQAECRGGQRLCRGGQDRRPRSGQDEIAVSFSLGRFHQSFLLSKFKLNHNKL